MRNTWIIIRREIAERLRTSSFWRMAIFGPILLMLLIFLLFHFGENDKPKWKILVVDPAMAMDNRINYEKDQLFDFDFLNEYIEPEDFAKGKRYQSYDGFLEINENVLANKTAFFFYRQNPPIKVQSRLHYMLEKRLEEVILTETSELSLAEYRKIKHPITLGFRNVYDPKSEKAQINSWVGLAFGAIIPFFIFIFGMSILRSISIEKSNRIIEVLLATVKPRQLMLGKMIGIGVSAIIQLFLWIAIMSLGLFLFREFFFDTINDRALAGNLMSDSGVPSIFGYNSALEYNQFVELIFSRINFSVMISYTILFLILGYLFYGSFFSGLGAMMGSESDGQQYVVFILGILFFTIIAGYLAVILPDSNLVKWLSYIPFTSPVVCMVKLGQGYPENESYQLIISVLILMLSIVGTLALAGKLYHKGILRFGRRVRLKDFF